MNINLNTNTNNRVVTLALLTLAISFGLATKIRAEKTEPQGVGDQKAIAEGYRQESRDKQSREREARLQDVNHKANLRCDRAVLYDLRTLAAHHSNAEIRYVRGDVRNARSYVRNPQAEARSNLRLTKELRTERDDNRAISPEERASRGDPDGPSVSI